MSHQCHTKVTTALHISFFHLRCLTFVTSLRSRWLTTPFFDLNKGRLNRYDVVIVVDDDDDTLVRYRSREKKFGSRTAWHRFRLDTETNTIGTSLDQPTQTFYSIFCSRDLNSNGNSKISQPLHLQSFLIWTFCFRLVVLFLTGLSRPLFLYFCLVYIMQLTVKFLPMSAFKPQISGVGSNHSANCATTTAQACRSLLH